MNHPIKRSRDIANVSMTRSAAYVAPRGGGTDAIGSGSILGRFDVFHYQPDPAIRQSDDVDRVDRRKPHEPETLAIVFQKFGPYHVDRIAAAKRILGEDVNVVGIEISEHSTTYGWDRAESNGFRRVTLFPGESWERISLWRRATRILAALRSVRAKHVLLINYQFPDIFLTALVLRLMGRRPYIMMASKFSDKERRIRLEKLKKLLLLPYVGGIASGESHLAYLRFLGLSTTNFHTGLDTLSAERIRALAGREPAPGGEPFHDRHFTIVARMVPEKDLPTAIHAYARYLELCRERGMPGRDLVLCGDGPEKDEIDRLVRDYGLDTVRFRGFVQEREVCETLATSVALILPSREEPWGLVINEAISLGVPILSSNVCGACDDLVRTGVNGFTFAPGEVEGLAQLMMLVSACKDQWARLCHGSLQMVPRADASRFAYAVAAALRLGDTPR